MTTENPVDTQRTPSGRPVVTPEELETLMNQGNIPESNKEKIRKQYAAGEIQNPASYVKSISEKIKKAPAQQYQQREYTGTEESPDEMYDRLGQQLGMSEA